MAPYTATPSQNLSLESARRALDNGFVSGKVTLPVLPAIAARVMTLANNPESDVAELADLIHQDQALAGNVLRVANSASYNPGESIVSLRQAVMRLGMSILSEIAIALCLHSAAFRTVGYERLRKQMMVHAFLSGGLAKELARRKRRNVESMFLCGLLHSIGCPVVLRVLSDLQKGARSMLSEADAERVMLEFEGQASAAVTMEWNLPRVVQVVAAKYRDPESEDEFVEEVKLTALADQLAWFMLDQDPPEDSELAKLPAWADLNFYPDDIEAIFERRSALRESAALFSS
jgi:HD-like signal output (HDOD) protein